MTHLRNRWVVVIYIVHWWLMLRRRRYQKVEKVARSALQFYIGGLLGMVETGERKHIRCRCIAKSWTSILDFLRSDGYFLTTRLVNSSLLCLLATISLQFSQGWTSQGIIGWAFIYAPVVDIQRIHIIRKLGIKMVRVIRFCSTASVRKLRNIVLRRR